jgi:hypothetical protein
MSSVKTNQFDYIADIGITGSVGIGTAPSSTYKLDCQGMMRIKDLGNSLYVFNDQFGIGTPDSSGLQLFYGDADNFRIGTMTSGGIFSETMRLDSSGNLGLGKAAPGVKFDVEGASGVSQRIGTSSSSFYIQHNGSTDTHIYTAESAPLRFGTNNTERMRVSASGNVGIGEVSPSTKLHITDGSGARIRVSGAVGSGIEFNDVNTRIAISATNQLDFYTSNANRMRISASGDVGIGADSPSNRVHITDTGSVFVRVESSTLLNTGQFGVDSAGVLVNCLGSYPMQFSIQGTNQLKLNPDTTAGTRGPITVGSLNTGINRFAYVDLVGDDTNAYGLRIIRNNTGVNANSVITHKGTGDLSLITEGLANLHIATSGLSRAFFSPAGAFQLGTLNLPDTTHSAWSSSITATTFEVANRSTSSSSQALSPLTIDKAYHSTGSNRYLNFSNNGTVKAYITIDNAGNATFQAVSDRRVKTNIQALTAINKIMQLNPVSYELKSGGDGVGFIAQEFFEVFPTFVDRTDDGAGSDLPNGVKPWSMGYGGLVPYLTKALQELKNIVDDQQREINTLKSKIEALEA